MKASGHVPCSVSSLSRFRPVGAAAAADVQIADIRKVMFIHDYQHLCPSYLLNSQFFGGRDYEIVVKNLAAVYSPSNKISTYVFRRTVAGRKHHLLKPE